MPSEPDEELGSAVDPAFDEHDAESLQSDVRRAVHSVCPWYLRHYVEDLAQNTMIRVVKAIRKSEGKTVLSTVFLRRVAHSAVVDEIRRRSRKSEYPMPETMPDLTVASPEARPDHLAVDRELREAIQECLGRMLEPRRRAVTLRLLGHTVPEAARILGWDDKRAENYVYRGLQDLRDCLANKGIEP